MELEEFLEQCGNSMEKTLTTDEESDLSMIYHCGIRPHSEFQNPLLVNTVIDAYKFGQRRGSMQRTEENIQRHEDYLKKN